jgi:hypothetical protein
MSIPSLKSLIILNLIKDFEIGKILFIEMSKIFFNIGLNKTIITLLNENNKEHLTQFFDKLKKSFRLDYEFDIDTLIIFRDDCLINFKSKQTTLLEKYFITQKIFIIRFMEETMITEFKYFDLSILELMRHTIDQLRISFNEQIKSLIIDTLLRITRVIYKNSMIDY